MEPRAGPRLTCASVPRTPNRSARRLAGPGAVRRHPRRGPGARRRRARAGRQRRPLLHARLPARGDRRAGRPAPLVGRRAAALGAAAHLRRPARGVGGAGAARRHDDPGHGALGGDRRRARLRRRRPSWWCAACRRRRGCRRAANDYRAVVAAVHEGVAVHALDGTVVSCNPSAERILRVPASEIVGRDWCHWQPVHEDGTPFTRDENPTAITAATGRPQTDVVMGLSMPGGERRWIAVNAEADHRRRRPGDRGRRQLLGHLGAPPPEGMVSRLGRILSQSRDEVYVFDCAHPAARAGQPQRRDQHRLPGGGAARDDPPRPAARARLRTPSRPSSSRCAAATSSGCSSRPSTGAATAAPTRSR